MTDNFHPQQNDSAPAQPERGRMPILRWIAVGMLAAIPAIAAVLAYLFLFPAQHPAEPTPRIAAVQTAAPSPDPSTERNEVTGVYFVGFGAGDTRQTLTLGDTVQLEVRLEPSDAAGTITWSSSDTGVAVVDSSGAVSAVYPGNVTITATCGAVSQACPLAVEPRDSYTLDQVHDTERTYFLSWIDARRRHADGCSNPEIQGHGDVCTGYFENGTLLYVDVYQGELIDLDNDEWRLRVDRVYFDAETDRIYLIRQTEEETGFVQELYYYDGLLFRTVGNGKAYDGYYDGYDYWANEYYDEMYETCKHVQRDY